MTNKMFLLIWLSAFSLTGSFVHAHSLWLNIDNDQPRVGQAVPIEIGWGHKFPKDEVIKEGFLKEIYACDVTGARTPLKQISQTVFEFIPQSEDTFTILANVHPGFLSKTTEGYKLQSKKGLENVVSCFRYDIRAKAMVNVGGMAKSPEAPIGDTLEIVPLKDPRGLDKGERLPVKIMYQGKPLASADVKATYAGFSDQPHTFAWSTATDKTGLAEIKILEKGDWLVNVVHEVPYPQQEECDQYRYNYSFGFRVK
jgi:uncharacterized GH25 family protein